MGVGWWMGETIGAKFGLLGDCQWEAGQGIDLESKTSNPRTKDVSFP